MNFDIIAYNLQGCKVGAILNKSFVVNSKTTKNTVESLNTIMGMVPKSTRHFCSKNIGVVLMSRNWTLVSICSTIHPIVISLMNSMPMNCDSFRREIVVYFYFDDGAVFRTKIWSGELNWKVEDKELFRNALELYLSRRTEILWKRTILMV